MSHNVHVHVCFPASDHDVIAAIAQKHLSPEAWQSVEAHWYLEELSKRTGTIAGPKGGLCLWGMVANGLDDDDFLNDLKPFWEEVLKSDHNGGPSDFERVLVFIEHQQTEKAVAYEIFLGPDPEKEKNRVFRPPSDSKEFLIVKKHLCPFSWMQY